MTTTPDPPATATASAARTLLSPLLAAGLVVALLSCMMWTEGDEYIEDTSSTLMGIRRLVSGDSEHYLAIADAFREGDFSMSHVAPTGGADRAHRQPGFPALLAAAGKLGISGAPALARVNLGVLVAALWVALVAVRLATGSSLAAVMAVAIVYNARFLFEIATQHLLAEPLYVLISLAAVGAALAYASRASALSLVGGAALAGAAYLVRVNGILLALALGGVVLAADLLRARRSALDVDAAHAAIPLPLAAYGAAAALFLIVTIPSWLPRVIYAGNPVYHGYLPNYLWVDDYSRAHAPGRPQFSLSTYVTEHHASDAAARLTYGMRRVFWDTPIDKLGVVASAAFALSLAVLLALRDPPGLLIACAGFVQALPLAWTAMSNPARRVCATALVPFIALAVAQAVAAVLRRAHRRQRESQLKA